MIERILNKLGVYTKEQYVRLENLLHSCNNIRHQAIKSLLASEEAKANVIEENKKLKSDYENVVAALKVCEDEKKNILAEKEDLKTAYENRKKQANLLLKDFEILSGENEELRKEVERLRLKVVRSVKRKKK